MNTPSFFAKPPKAERAFLSAYGAKELRGRFGIRIELEPLWFADSIESPERRTDIILDHLALPSIVPTELQNTQFMSDDERSNSLGYEGSWYFRGQHNWVDLKEIRFLDAVGDTVAAEYHLVIHLPVSRANKEPLVLTVPTKVEPHKGEFVPKPPRYVLAIGNFAETSENFWECESTYHGCPVKIQLHAEPDSFERIATFAKSVIVENAITPTYIRQHVEELIGTLQWKFDEFKVRTPFRAEELVPNWFSFFRDRDSDELTLSIGLSDPTDSGKWYLRFHGTTAWNLDWVPK